MGTTEALKNWTSFLETTPPNTSVTIPSLAHSFGSGEGWALKIPQIQLHCGHDGGPRRFDPKYSDANVTEILTYKFITYQCRDCQTTQKTFAVAIHRFKDGDVEAMKLGEFPPFSVPISSRIQKLLSEPNLELYQKGSRAEAQGSRRWRRDVLSAHCRGAMETSRDRNPSSC